MAQAPKLKVYRTAVGFHDAYVAAANQKAALRAWGSNKDLFARGVAELVTDEALTEAPLQSPGTVIKRTRGTLAEQLAALPPREPGEPKPRPRTETKARSAAAKTKAKPKPKRTPKPSRSSLDEAERALARAERRQRADVDGLRQREEALAQERRDLLARQEDEMRELAAARDEAESTYRAALSDWASQD